MQDKEQMIQDKVERIKEKEKCIQDLNNTLEHYKLHYNSAIAQRDHLTNRLLHIENEYNVMLNSTSWKITKPLRVILDYTKKFLKSNRYTHTICKGLKCLKKNGFKYTLKKIKRKFKVAEGYKEYAKQNILTDEEKSIQSNTN